ncbi:hypothetical protein H4R33_004923 [Dimargaris cristalligena]|uniref:Mycolic acid cyclopropane synthetase-domain-containing protein n=1 Tax=Dimargaris cristalligena TaxID=215637 RepID=A0A4P9ZUF9_9FUNG|nr:hypothetical protein H4R33_004923 [Dimargaris cristalligena]RKP37236.1 Mycolic acid cyclopropane synthetase-domain-containing protein [Dimargaris cristalligena]|eukprot:RKP37236.1 Mycolic acid cyclopropane synthetase-domain-containing protein [Dimargaris cristalligena]
MNPSSSAVPNSLLAHIANTLRSAKDSALKGLWPVLIGFCKSNVLGILAKILVGQLEIVTDEGIHSFGSPSSNLKPVKIRVLSDTFWVRLVLRSDLGFSEAYMKREIEVSDLVGFIKLFLNNRESLSDGSNQYAIVFNSLDVLMHSRLANTINNAVNNISAHYDLGNDMFAEFLDPTMTYSSAIWRNPEDSLEMAQINKLTMVIEKARIVEGDHVLEIGTGWGSLAILAVQRTGCRVTSLTLSSEQKQLAEERVAKAGFSGRITVLLCDYRNLSPTEHQFDKIVSIEMIEAVGADFMPTYFNCCHQLLHPHHGVFVLQGITMPESRYPRYRKGVDFIRKYIFPGGECPTVTSLVEAAQVGSDGGHLVLDHLENFPLDYARTLREWRHRFLQNYDSQIASHSPLNDQGAPIYDGEFKRKWEYYFAYCEGAYATRTLGLVQMVFTRMANARLLDSRSGY